MAYDGQDLIVEFTSGGGVAKRYVHGPGADEPLVWYEGSTLASRRFLVADERGSIVLITGDDGKKIAQNSYDDWGVPTGSHSGRFGYTGQAKIGGTELWHYKARAYSPASAASCSPSRSGSGTG